MTLIFVNGKFLAQRPTGVQRSAREWLQALDELLVEQPSSDDRWIVLHPPELAPPRWRRIASRAIGMASIPLHAWEQVCLPFAARDGLLVNLAGSAPWFASAQVVTLHDAAIWDRPDGYSWAFKAWYRALFRRVASSAAGMFTVSEYSRRRLALRLGVCVDRFEIIGNGADHLSDVRPDPQALERHGLSCRRYVLAVGSANPNKNMRRLSEAVGSLPESLGLRLVVVGGTNRRVFAGGAALGGDRVQDVGAVDDATLKALIEGAVALAMPSLYEGFGLPPLEAMACGCPVVVSDLAALPETCADAAVYVDPLSVDSIADGLLRVAGDADLRHLLVERGRRVARAHTWRDAAAALRGHVLRLGEAGR